MNVELGAVEVKYVFIDIVGYSRDRTVEAQSIIIGELNNKVRSVVENLEVDKDKVMYIPTGDGICIAFVGIEKPYDVHLETSIKVLEKLSEYNNEQNDKKLKLEVRIGINENLDNVIKDVNERKNVAGSGITLAQRIMDAGDEKTILVGESVHEKLAVRDKYYGMFHKYSLQIKHGTVINVYQYLDKDNEAISKFIPMRFRKAEDKKIDRLSGYFIAHVIKQREFICECVNKYGGSESAIFCLMTYLAIDSLNEEKATDMRPFESNRPNNGNNTLEEDLDIYRSYEFNLVWDYGSLFKKEKFGYSNVFTGIYCLEVTKKGVERLTKEQPDIAEKFGIKIDEEE